MLHDSLFKDINESIMNRERIITRKIFTSSLAEMNEKLDEIKDVDVIIIQVLTNSLREKII